MGEYCISSKLTAAFQYNFTSNESIQCDVF
jgi:hypothetical protein